MYLKQELENFLINHRFFNFFVPWTLKSWQTQFKNNLRVQIDYVQLKYEFLQKFSISILHLVFPYHLIHFPRSHGLIMIDQSYIFFQGTLRRVPFLLRVTDERMDCIDLGKQIICQPRFCHLRNLSNRQLNILSMIWKIDIRNFLGQLFLRLGFHGTYVNSKINYCQTFLDKKVWNNTNYIWRNFTWYNWLNLMRICQITVNHISATIYIYSFCISWYP